MAEANRKEEVNADIAAVWDLITSLENYSWRSDLDRIEILEPGRTFREYTRDGFATTFTITVCKPMNRYGKRKDPGTLDRYSGTDTERHDA